MSANHGLDDEELVTTTKKHKKNMKRELAQSWREASGDISEIPSANRFQDQAKRQALRHGRAFDLRLGDGLRTEAGRERVWRHLREEQPKVIV